MAPVALTRLRMDELANAWVSDENTPFQMGLLCEFDAAPLLRPDGTLDAPRIRAELANRAGRVAALGRRVVWTRIGEGRPVWANDPSFDPARHVLTAILPAGQDLAAWAANRAVQPLEMDRPLWRADIVHALPDTRFAVLLVMHHILADGVAGLALVGQLLDPAPDFPPVTPWMRSETPLPVRRELVRQRLREARDSLRRNGPHADPSPAPARERPHRNQHFMGLFAGQEPQTSLPRRIGPERRLAIVRVPLADVIRTAHALGVTVNDLLLTAVTSGVRDLLAARGELIPGLVLRTSVPAATGGPGQVAAMIVAELPVGEPDPLRRLALVTRSTTSGKSQLRAGVGDGRGVLALPVFLARPIVRWARQFGSRRLSLSVADIPGPPNPLWLAGARLRRAAPIPPLTPLVPVCVAALSYAGELAVSVNADAAITDLDRLADGIRHSFAMMQEATRTGELLPPALPAPLVGRGRLVIDCAIDIERPADVVFAYGADASNEPQWNPQLRSVTILTEGPIGVGTRYRMRFRTRGGRRQHRRVRGFRPPTVLDRQEQLRSARGLARGADRPDRRRVAPSLSCPAVAAWAACAAGTAAAGCFAGAGGATSPSYGRASRVPARRRATSNDRPPRGSAPLGSPYEHEERSPALPAG